MPQSRFPPSLVSKGDRDDIARPGYVRCKATHIGSEWNFEELSGDPKIAVATIQTVDGPVHIGLKREDAEAIVQKMQLFLADWPKDRAKS